MNNFIKKLFSSILLFAMLAAPLSFSGCSKNNSIRIIRIGHNQSTNHPTHIGLTAFANYINENLGNKYKVEVFPSELLGSQTEMVQLTQTGAIEFVVASNSILETFSKNYEIFNLPFLFSSTEAYHAAMDDPTVTDPIFSTTSKAGIIAVTWLDAGTRNFYTTNTPINSPSDLKGLKIRVQQSPTNVSMMSLLGGSATPLSFGDVYTALQSKIIDGAENNELALTENGHGDVCKYYSYDMHQMIPDIVLANYDFLNNLTKEERTIFENGFKILNSVQREEWQTAVQKAKDRAQNVQGVNFLYPPTEPFRKAVMPLHDSVLKNTPELQPIYKKIAEYNELYPSKE